MPTPINGDFVHLHCHSEFSLLDGANRLDPLIARAVELGMPALAITDHGVMYGAAEFYSKCKEYKIRPILGVEAYVAPRGRKQREPKLDSTAYHMVLLAKSMQGYRNLLKLSSIAALEGFYYKPRIDREVLERFHEGIIGTSACLSSEINTLLLKGEYNAARDAAAYYSNLFGKDDYYIELQNHNLPEQEHCNEQLLKISRELNLPIICSNDVHYLGSQDAAAHDILVCIGTGATVLKADRMRLATQEFYLKDAAAMKQLFGAYPGAIENTLGIAERCNVELEYGRCPMPSPGIPEGISSHAHLTNLAQTGLARKFGGNPPNNVVARLNYELEIIETTGFSQYMLIVQDFAKFAVEKGILFGVRGSAAGSLTSYLLDITDIDPIEYGLTFERFLNPERVQMPDVDMDFEDTRRAEVIRYVTEKYNRTDNEADEPNDPLQARVAQITTFGTLAARAVLKDAGRALGMSISQIEKLTKLVPTLPLHMTIDKTLETVPEFRSAYEQDAEAKNLIDTARRLEGISRHASVHAAGVIISHDPLVDYTPLTRSADGGCVTQYVASTLEKIGLLKMDFLGLINLSILGQAVKNVEASTGVRLDVRSLPLDDAKTYELLGNGECVGVFQLEGPQMRRYIQELKPTNVRDVAAMVALYRPGPMAHIPKFVRCKHGQEKIEYPHPLLKDLLEETYGVIVYQDQVMHIAQVIAGYSLGQADILRRAMGKKKKDEMEKERANFLRGAEANNVDKKVATRIFDLMEPFAGYAFNKAHAVCYAMVAYQTAYLKANYPIEYMAALLTCFIEKSDKLVTCMDECKRMNISVLPPDVNRSKCDFAVEGYGIRYGLAAIKNVGRATVEGILRSRDDDGFGPFNSLQDFCSRVMTSDAGAAGTGRGTIEALIQAGAFAGMPQHQNRRALVHILDSVMVGVSRTQREKKAGQSPLDMFNDDSRSEPLPVPDVADYPRDQILAFERDLLGLYISDHPLEALRETFDRDGVRPIVSLSEMADRAEVTLGGIISSVKPYTSRKSGEPMAFFTLEDTTGNVACTIFPSNFAQYRENLVKDRIVIVKGKANHRDRVRDTEDTGHIVEVLADQVQLVGDISGSAGNGPGKIVIRVDGSKRNVLQFVREAVDQFRGNGNACPIYLRVTEKGAVHEVRTLLRAEYSEPFRAAVEHILGAQTVWAE